MPVDLYPKQTPLREISTNTLFNFKKKTDLPMTAIDCIMTEIRKDLESRGIELNASKTIKDKSFFLERYYHNQSIEFQYSYKVDIISKHCIMYSKHFEVFQISIKYKLWPLYVEFKRATTP